MKLSKVLLACAMLFGISTLSMPAYAAAICPAAGVVITQLDCNLFITFNADGSVTTTAGTDTTYDGIEDAVIGVINNTTHAITSFSLSAPGIFGFDGDGICFFTGCVSTVGDMSGYGGVNAFYTITDLNNGIVNFGHGGIAAGSNDYFSLEEPASLTIIIGAPEPATMALLGIALLGAGLARRRQS